MNGTLRRIEKELRNIAKRYKNIKYSKSLLLRMEMKKILTVGKVNLQSRQD